MKFLYRLQETLSLTYRFVIHLCFLCVIWDRTQVSVLKFIENRIFPLHCCFHFALLLLSKSSVFRMHESLFLLLCLFIQIPLPHLQFYLFSEPYIFHLVLLWECLGYSWPLPLCRNCRISLSSSKKSFCWIILKLVIALERIDMCSIKFPHENLVFCQII